MGWEGNQPTGHSELPVAAQEFGYKVSLCLMKSGLGKTEFLGDEMEMKV